MNKLNGKNNIYPEIDFTNMISAKFLNITSKNGDQIYQQKLQSQSVLETFNIDNV